MRLRTKVLTGHGRLRRTVITWRRQHPVEPRALGHSCVVFVVARLVIPIWPSARTRRCHEPDCRLKQLFILSLAGAVGALTRTHQRSSTCFLRAKRSRWSAREERIHDLRILPQRELNEEKTLSGAARRELIAELASVSRVADVSVVVTADASAAFAAQGLWCTLRSPPRRRTCLMASPP